MSHYSMAFVRWYLSHAVTTSRKFDRITGWYLAIPSCLVVFKGVTVARSHNPEGVVRLSFRAQRANGIYLPCGGLCAPIP